MTAVLLLLACSTRPMRGEPVAIPAEGTVAAAPPPGAGPTAATIPPAEPAIIGPLDPDQFDAVLAEHVEEVRPPQGAP